MKKVLVFSLGYFPNAVGGAEVSVKELTDRMLDIEFHLIANRYDAKLPKEERIGNVIVHRIGITSDSPTIADMKKLPLALNKPLYQFLAVVEAVRLHRKFHFDAMWAVMAHASGVPAALTKLIFPKLPYLLNLQEGDKPEHIERKMKPVWPLFVRAFTSANMVQTLSYFLADWAKRRGFSGEPVVIINGVDAQHFAKPVSDSQIVEVKKEIGKKDGDVYLVTTSRLVPKNAVDVVIRALAHLPEHVHFLIYGTGPDEVQLKTLTKELSLTNRVHFAGHIAHEHMPSLLKACDIFIRPSRSEGSGASFIEAMAAGLPVIATQEGGIADFLFDEKKNPGTPTTGWAVGVDSPDDIANAVNDIMSRQEKTKEVVARAKKMAVEEYDWNILAKRMRNEVFEKLFQ